MNDFAMPFKGTLIWLSAVVAAVCIAGFLWAHAKMAAPFVKEAVRTEGKNHRKHAVEGFIGAVVMGGLLATGSLDSLVRSAGSVVNNAANQVSTGFQQQGAQQPAAAPVVPAPATPAH